MDSQGRRAAIRDYKERKVAQGVFAVRCAATGEAWVAASRDLAQQPNRIWFSLRLGGCRNAALQAAYAADGEAGLAIEILETFETEDLSPYELANRLKDREAHWRTQLGAARLAG